MTATQNGNVWTLQDAKNRFSEVVRAALDTGPQIVTRRGEEAVVIVDAKEFARLGTPKMSLLEVMQRAPLPDGVQLDIPRMRGGLHDVDLSGLFEE